jgi:creatinine amidohydrolase
MDFGGTITVSQDTFGQLLSEISDAALENGFDALVFVNGHGGNIPLIDSAVSTVGVDNPDVEISGVTYFELATDFVADIRDSDVGGMAHGGEFETALMLYLYPELVQMDAAESIPLEEPDERAIDDMFVGGPLSVYRPFIEYSASGAIGDATVATPEKGKKLYSYLTDEIAAILRDIHDRVA